MKKLYLSMCLFLFIGVGLAADKLVGSFPRYKLTTTDNQNFSSASLRGSAVFLTFFSRACKPCEKEVPFLNSLAVKYKGFLYVLGVPFMEEPEAVPALVKAWNIAYPVCFDSNGVIAKAFNVSVLPRGFLFDHRGMVISDYKGLSERDQNDIISKLNSLLPLIRNYRDTGPSFFVKPFEEKTPEAAGLGAQWASRVTDWAKQEGAVILDSGQKADYIIGGEVAKIGKVLGVVITISYAGTVEKTISDRVIGDNLSRLRGMFVENLRTIPYFPKRRN